jgi:Bax protein
MAQGFTRRFKEVLARYLRIVAPYALLIFGFSLLVIGRLYFTKFTYGIRTQTVTVTSPKQIVRLNSDYVVPVLYTHVNGLADLPVHEAKATFISVVLPAVLVAKHEIEMVKVRLQQMKADASWDREDSTFYFSMKNKFKGKNISEMLTRIGTLPSSIVIAQAAVESGWGQSRFFLQANNLFGIWSFDSSEPRIAAGEARGSKTVYLKSYFNMSESILNYFEILSSSPAYTTLRNARSDSNDPFVLLPHLINFSERRKAYTNQLKTVIEQNDLTRYDSYRVDPDYIFER